MADKKATIDSVAKLAGVSNCTVSRILAAAPGQNLPYADATQEKVRNAAKLLGYRPSKLAGGLRQARTGIIGLVIPSVEDSFFPGITRVIGSLLVKSGYSVILCDTQSDSKIERRRIDELLGWQVDGLIVAPAQETMDAGLYWELWQMKVPFVLIDRSFPHTPFYDVTADDYTGGVLGTEHLISLGHKTIACAMSPLMLSTNKLRHAGYVDTLVRHRILPDPSYTIQEPSDEEGGVTVLKRIQDMSPRPTALFCFSDMTAIGVMEECLKQGIRIPEDLALMGYADLKHSNMLRVPLTTIRQPQGHLGECAAKMLLARIDGKHIEHPQQILPVELVVRESTIGPGNGIL